MADPSQQELEARVKVLQLQKQKAEAMAAAEQEEGPRKRTPQEMRSAFDEKYWETALSGPLGPVQRAFGAFEGAKQMNKSMEEGAYEAGGRVTDIASKVLPPGGAASLGYVTNVGLNAIPTLATGGMGAMAGKGVGGVPLRRLSEWFMSSALKPRGEVKTIEGAKAVVDTMLREGISVSEGGVAKLKGKINELNSQISQAIATSPETVNKAGLRQYIQQELDRFSVQANAQKDVADIKRVWQNFKDNPIWRNIPDLPVSMAQDIKQGTYKALTGKYGRIVPDTGEVAAEKAIARGLKEGIAAKVPSIGDLNARESELLKALKPTEARVLQELRNNPGGLAWLAHNPVRMIEFMADKSSSFKSLLARMINTSAVPLSEITGATLGSGPQILNRAQDR